MPEANVLYAVTAVVIAGLVAWVAFVLKTAKEPWARPVSAVAAARARTPDVPVEKEADEDGEEKSAEDEEAASAPEAEAKEAASASEPEAKDEAAEAAEDEEAAAKTDAKA